MERWSASQWYGDTGRIRTRFTRPDCVLQSRSWTSPFVSPNRPREVLLVKGDHSRALFSAHTKRGSGEDRGEEKREGLCSFAQYLGEHGPDWRSFQERDCKTHARRVSRVQ